MPCLKRSLATGNGIDSSRDILKSWFSDLKSRTIPSFQRVLTLEICYQR